MKIISATGIFSEMFRQSPGQRLPFKHGDKTVGSAVVLPDGSLEIETEDRQFIELVRGMNAYGASVGGDAN